MYRRYVAYRLKGRKTYIHTNVTQYRQSVLCFCEKGPHTETTIEAKFFLVRWDLTDIELKVIESKVGHIISHVC